MICRIFSAPSLPHLFTESQEEPSYRGKPSTLHGAGCRSGLPLRKAAEDRVDRCLRPTHREGPFGDVPGEVESIRYQSGESRLCYGPEEGIHAKFREHGAAPVRWARPDLRTDRDVVLRGSGLFCLGSIRAASLVTRRFRSEETAMRSNKVTLIWGILTLVSLLVVLVLVVLGVVSL